MDETDPGYETEPPGGPAGEPTLTYSLPDAAWYVPRAVRKFLLPVEPARNVIAVRQHQAVLFVPDLALLGGLAAAVALNSWLYVAGWAYPFPVGLIWAAWLAVLAWCAYRTAAWYCHWIVITPVRIMTVTGLISRKVNPLPLRRARDVEMYQGIAGRTFGYGTLITQSFGTDHQLAVIEYVPEVVDLFDRIWALLVPEESQRMPRGWSADFDD